DRLALERKHHEPQDQYREDRAEQERGDVVADALRKPALDQPEHDAPNAAPERERPDLRHAPRLRLGIAERRPALHARIEDGDGTVLEHDHGNGARKEQRHDIVAERTDAAVRPRDSCRHETSPVAGRENLASRCRLSYDTAEATGLQRENAGSGQWQVRT